jgi:putative transposase
LHWVFEAKKRYGLSVLDYMVTSNHIHLLVKDTGANVIAESIQLIAGRTAQEYNQRKGKQGAFWEDRYHATAIESEEYLDRWLVYIDLNMVRARVAAEKPRAPLSQALRKPAGIYGRGALRVFRFNAMNI